MTSAYIDRLSWKEEGRWVHLPGSNFYIEPDKTHVEGEYQAAKHKSPWARKAAAKRFCRMSPGRAKQAGRRVELRDDWDDVKRDIMYDLVRRKFIEHEECRDWLLGTGNALIVEGNTWHDNYWGQCRCGSKECKRFQGKNALGRILMDIRAELRGGTPRVLTARAA